MEIDDVNNNAVEPMEVDEDEAANELSYAIQTRNPFRYAKLSLHREVTNRDAKISELLTKVDDCHQHMHFIQSGGRLLELQRDLSQQIEAHQQTKDSMDFKNTTCEFLSWRVRQQNEENCKLEAKLKSDERMVEEAALKTKQCDELLVQLRHQAEEYLKLEDELKRDGIIKFAKDDIMKRLVDETKNLTSKLHDQQQQMRDMAQCGKNDSAVFDKQRNMNGFERMIEGEHLNVEDLQQRRNMNDAPSGIDAPSIVSHVNPFKEENVQKKEMENDANINNHYKHAKYEKDYALQLASNTPMQNPFKCDTMGQKTDVVVDRRNKNQTSKVHTTNPFKKPYFVTSKAKYERDLEKELDSNTPINPFKRETIRDKGKQTDPKEHPSKVQEEWNPFKVETSKTKKVVGKDQSNRHDMEKDRSSTSGRNVVGGGVCCDGIPEKYKNLPSNVYLNPFKYPNAASVVNNKERPPNTKRPTAHSKTYVKRTAVDKSYIKRSTADSKTYVQRPAVNSMATWVKRPADNTKTWLKRPADNDQWETDSNDFKKTKIAEENHQHQQQHQHLKSIPNGKGRQNFNPFKGGKQGAVAENENGRKIKIRRDGPYNRSNSTEGMKG